MANNSALEDGHIAGVANRISHNEARMVSVVYMGAEHKDLDEWKGVRGSEVSRSLLETWRNKTGATVQVHCRIRISL